MNWVQKFSMVPKIFLSGLLFYSTNYLWIINYLYTDINIYSNNNVIRDILSIFIFQMRNNQCCINKLH